MQFSASISGVKELDATFTALPKQSERLVYRQSLREGAKIVEKSAENNIRKVSKKFTGLAQRRSSISVYNLKKYKGNYRVAVQVKRGLVNQMKTDKDGPVRVGAYLAVLEYGSQKLNRRPRPWIRPAIRNEKNAALERISKEFARRLDFAVKRARSITA